MPKILDISSVFSSVDHILTQTVNDNDENCNGVDEVDALESYSVVDDDGDDDDDNEEEEEGEDDGDEVDGDGHDAIKLMRWSKSRKIAGFQEEF
eukprot:763314-Hanusia_phi.AAC.4